MSSVCVCVSGSAGQNKQHLVTKNTAKLDRETEELHHVRVPHEVGKVIQIGRANKGLTQKDLATVSVHTHTHKCSKRSRAVKSIISYTSRLPGLSCVHFHILIPTFFSSYKPNCLY